MRRRALLVGNVQEAFRWTSHPESHVSLAGTRRMGAKAQAKEAELGKKFHDGGLEKVASAQKTLDQKYNLPPAIRKSSRTHLL